LPINLQFLFVYLNPCLHHLQLLGWQPSVKHRTIFNRNSSLVALLTSVDVRQIVLFVVTEEHENKYSVEHADGRHRFLLLVIVASIAAVPPAPTFSPHQ
jgi:hypothetical protein